MDENKTNVDTILIKTKNLLKCCSTEDTINNKHIDAILELLKCFFEEYIYCNVTSVIWQVVDQIIIFEGIIEEKKKINVDLIYSIKLCEYIFNKLIDYTTYDSNDILYLFSFICLKRQLCSLINTLIHYNNRDIRRGLEKSFTKELINLIKNIFDSIKKENDLEIKKYYTELLWRSFRKVNLDLLDVNIFNVKKEIIEKFKNFQMDKFDEVCINWLKQENYIQSEYIIDKGSFTITTNKKTVQNNLFFCYIGKCSIIIYFNNDEICKIEIPYYHIISSNLKENNFIMECKNIVDQTNIFSLWGEYIKKCINYEIINKFKISLDISKCSKETKNEIQHLLKKINERLLSNKIKKSDDKKNTYIDNINVKISQNEYINKKKLYNFDENESDISSNDIKQLEAIPSKTDKGNKKLINSYSGLFLKNKSRKRIETFKEKEKKISNKKLNKNIYKDKKVYTLEEITNNYKKEFESENVNVDSDFKIDLNTPKGKLITKYLEKDILDKDSDTELILEKIISFHKKKQEKFQENVKKTFEKSLNEINEKINLLIEKQKIRREDFVKKYNDKKNTILLNYETNLPVTIKEIKSLMEKIKNININKSEFQKLMEEGKSIATTDEILNKSEIFVKTIKENLENMKIKIINKKKEYNKRKKLCYKALSTAYE